MAEHQYQARKEQRHPHGPDELLGQCFMLFHGGMRDDGFNTAFLALAGIHRDQGSAEQEGLEGNDGEPGASSNTAGPEGPREANRQRRDDERQAQGQVYDRGMQWEGCHDGLLSGA
jgi:hypothetical protein